MIQIEAAFPCRTINWNSSSTINSSLVLKSIKLSYTFEMGEKKEYGTQLGPYCVHICAAFPRFYSITLHSIGIYGICPMFEMLPHFLSIQHLEVIDLGNIHFYDIRYFEPFRSVMLSCIQCHVNISTRDETYFKINFSLSSVCLIHIIVNGINRIRLNVNTNTNA